MAQPIIMPKQGQSVESCIISRWHKKKGDKVEAGDVLFSYETDKASFEEESPVSGILLDVFFEEGDDVPCLLNVCVIGQEGESTSEFKPNIGDTGESGEDGATSNTIDLESTDTADSANIQHKVSGNSSDSTGTHYPLPDKPVSPRARNLAKRTGVDYRQAIPSGPNGRIIERDIRALLDSGLVYTPAARDEVKLGHTPEAIQGTGLGGRITTDDLIKAQDNKVQTDTKIAQATATSQPITEPLYEEVQLPHIRKVIAKAMHQSLATTAQLTLNTSFDATELLNYRKKLKEAKDRLDIENITINDMILFAVSRTLLNHRDLNAHLIDDKMRYFSNVNLGNAVDTDRGLMVPTIFGADTMSLNEISAQAKKLAQDCKAGTINPDYLKNGSFTVTNLGTLDVESFTPVLNPPQTGILGVNNIVQRVREINGEYEFYPAMGLSLTFDHRAVDGAPAARFLKDLKTNLENFSVLLVR
jgi:pyruvate dehydrogenase E2 component (dihydrolipoamide acetyltransferase)